MDNVLFTEASEILAKIDPASYSSAQNSSWVKVDDHTRIVALIHVGAIAASGTFDAKLQRAKDGSGTGAEDITGKAITQLTQAGSGSNKQLAIELRSDKLAGQTNGDFTHVRLVLTPAVAATIVGAEIYGISGRYRPVDQTNWAQVK